MAIAQQQTSLYQYAVFLNETSTIEDIQPNAFHLYVGKADLIIDLDFTIPYPLPVPIQQNFSVINDSAFTFSIISSGSGGGFSLPARYAYATGITITDGGGGYWEANPSTFVLAPTFQQVLSSNNVAVNTNAIFQDNSLSPNYETRFYYDGFFAQDIVNSNELWYNSRFIRKTSSGLKSFFINMPDLSANAPLSSFSANFRPNVSGMVAYLSDNLAEIITTSATTTVLLNETKQNIVFTGTSIDQIVNIGNATTYAVGKRYTIISDNTEVINIVNNSGNTLLRLEPYNTVEFVLTNNSPANGVWNKTVTFAPADRGYNFREEFNTGTTITGMTAWSSTATGTGAGATSVGTLFGRRAVYQISTGTTNTGRIAFSKSGNGVIFGSNIMFCYETQIYIPTLSTAGERYLWTCGYGDNIVLGDHLDGVYFEYDESIGATWRLKTASNGTRTTTVTLVPVVAGSWIKLRAEVNRAGTEVLYFINNQFVGNITTNIPNAVGRNTDLLYKINKTVGLTARTVLVDYCSENTYLNR